jgi:hypothetical protein
MDGACHHHADGDFHRCDNLLFSSKLRLYGSSRGRVSNRDQPNYENITRLSTPSKVLKYPAIHWTKKHAIEFELMHWKQAKAEAIHAIERALQPHWLH